MMNQGKRFKRLGAVVLALVMLITMLPVTEVWADDTGCLYLCEYVDKEGSGILATIEVPFGWVKLSEAFGDKWIESLEADEKRGEFVGWYYDGEIVDGESRIYFPAPFSRYIKPVYEKTEVVVRYSFFDENLIFRDDIIELFYVSPDSTYQDIIDMIKLPNVEGCTFINWDFSDDEVDLNEVVGYFGDGLSMRARYDNYPVQIIVEYEDENSEIVRDINKKLYPAGTRLQEVYDETIAEIDSSISENVVEWIVEFGNLNSKVGPYSNLLNLCITAKYAETPENPDTPSAPTEPIDKTTEIINQIEEAIKEAEKNESAEAVQVAIDMKNEDGTTMTEIRKEVLETVKGQNVALIFNMGEYSWEINGKDMDDTDLKDVNLEVTFDTTNIPSDVIAGVAGENESRQLSLTYNGDFGYTAKLTFNVGKENNGKNGSLYYYNETEKLELVDTDEVDEEGNISFVLSHASDYVVIIDADEEATLPSKGDNTNIALSMSVLLIGAGLIVASLKKRKAF